MIYPRVNIMREACYKFLVLIRAEKQKPEELFIYGGLIGIGVAVILIEGVMLIGSAPSWASSF